MISFVWSSKYPFLAGSGGSENYTAGQIRELMRRGIPCRILTYGFGTNDGRDQFPDIPFKALSSLDELRTLDDTIVFVTYPRNVQTKHQSYVILHCPPMTAGAKDPLFDKAALHGKRIITPSKFSAKMWARQLGRSPLRIPVAAPFAETCFSQVKRGGKTPKLTRILFAGRLTVDKGIYTLLATLHLHNMAHMPIELTATTAGAYSEEGKVILKLLKAHPAINVVEARKTPEAMAELMAHHEVVVMPSTNIFWKEAFGIVSVEAQHAGCRVVASRAGGLPETDCGGLITVTPDNPQALAKGILRAMELGPLTEKERARACTRFTVRSSVDALLGVIAKQERTRHPHVGPVRLANLSPQLALFGDRLRQSVYPGGYSHDSSLARQKS